MNEHLPIVRGFLSYLTDERHFSPYTSRCYGVDLRQYVDFIATQFGITVDDAAETAAIRPTGTPAPAGGPTVTAKILAADVELIRSFLASLGEHHYSAATMARKIATLRSFYKWLEKRGYVATNPMTLIRTPRQDKRLPKAIDRRAGRAAALGAGRRRPARAPATARSSRRSTRRASA